MAKTSTTKEQLKERIKELTCLYEVTSIIVNCDYNNLQKCLQEISFRLKEALLYNNEAYVEIKTKDYFVSSEALSKNMVSISSDLYASNHKEGVLKVGYPDDKFTESDFLYEEKQLITKIGLEIGNLLERKNDLDYEELLNRKVQRADRVNILGEITAGIAHELNTPLTNILGFAELLKSKFKIETQEANDIDKIINNAIFTREVVKKLMFFACEMPQQKVFVNINEVITDAIALLDPTFKKHKISYKLNFSNPTIYLRIDTIQLTQVMFNLVLNAIYFSPPKSIITIDVTNNENGVKLSIADEGDGIKHNISDKIFNPFFTTKPVGDGAGLGLSVVHGIIKSHNGTIKHMPNKPKGTIFIINFPNL